MPGKVTAKRRCRLLLTSLACLTLVFLICSTSCSPKVVCPVCATCPQLLPVPLVGSEFKQIPWGGQTYLGIPWARARAFTAWLAWYQTILLSKP
jgi:hypothetical protein